MWLDDGKLETIYEKRSTCLIFMEKIHLLFDLIRSKIFHENRLSELEFLRKYCLVIRNIFTKYATLYGETETFDYLRSTSFTLNIISQRQMEVHSLSCNICHYMTLFKPFLTSTLRVRALNEFIRVTTSVAQFVENYLTKSTVF